MLAALSPRGCLRELLDEGVALLLDGGDRGGGRGLVLLADGEVELLDGGVESLGLLLVATLVRNEVVHVEAEGTDLAAELVGGLGPVGLADVLTHVLVEALDGLGRANRGLGGGELLEVAAGVAVLAHGLGDVEITGLCESREETGSSVDARLSLQGCGFGWRGTNKLTTPRGDHVGSPRVGLDWPGTHLVDELETVLVGLALILELDRVERHGGGGLESDDTGREEGGSLRGRIRLEERTMSSGFFCRQQRRAIATGGGSSHDFHARAGGIIAVISSPRLARAKPAVDIPRIAGSDAKTGESC